RTPTRGGAPSGAQIEYERRSSRPSTHRRRVSDWPARNAYAPARSSGTSKVTATASSHRRSTEATVSSWNSPRNRGLVTVTSDLLDVLERLGTGATPVQLLARRRAEPRHQLGVPRPAPRARHGRRRRVEGEGDGATACRAGRRDAGVGELAPALRCDPVGGPRRMQDGAHLDVLVPRVAERVHKVVAHRVHRRAA